MTNNRRTPSPHKGRVLRSECRTRKGRLVTQLYHVRYRGQLVIRTRDENFVGYYWYEDGSFIDLGSPHDLDLMLDDQ